MANTVIDMRKIKKIFQYYTEGLSKRQISIRLHISRNTVKKYIALFVESRLTSDEINELPDQELYELIKPQDDPLASTTHKYVFDLFPQVSKELKKVGVTRLQLWEKYALQYNNFLGYSRFCHLYRLWSFGQSPVMRFEHKAGDKMFVDYTGKKLSIVDFVTGEVTEVEVFVAVLGASGYTYVEACRSQKREDFIGCLVGALNFFGGVPRAIVTDNLKAAVVKGSKYEPIINDSMLSFAHHYDTTILPTRVYKPRDKGLVENAVKIVYTRVFAPVNKKNHYSLEELNKSIKKYTINHNQTNLTKRDCSRLDLFEELEKPALNPLPELVYQVRYYYTGTVYKSSHVHLNPDKHYYSVPYKYIGKKVRIHYTKDIVEIFFKQQRIAVHKRHRRKYGYTTEPLHMPSTHRYITEWNPDKFLNWASGIGPHCRTLISLLLVKRQHPEQSYKSCTGILMLTKKVGKERLNNACKRALDYERINYQSVKSILEKGLDRIQEDTHQESAIPDHPNIRGGNYYK